MNREDAIKQVQEKLTPPVIASLWGHKVQFVLVEDEEEPALILLDDVPHTKLPKPCNVNSFDLSRSDEHKFYSEEKR